jgi:hypothetical protein
MNQPNLDKKTGIQTDDANVIVCQCGSVSFEVKKRTATAVSLTCRKCEADISVKGSVAQVRIRSNDIAYAITEKVVRPDPDYKKSKKTPTETSSPATPTLADQGYRTLRFKISKDQDEIVQRAMEVMRVMHCQDEQFKSKQWQGSSLELICAEFLSGADSRALSVVTAMEEEVEKAKAQQLIKDKTVTLTKRKIRKVRTDTRERMYKELGLDEEVEAYEPPELTKDEKKSDESYKKAKKDQEEKEDEDIRLIDDDRLYDSVGGCLIEHGEGIKEQTGKRPVMLIGRPNDKTRLEQKFEKHGGTMYLLTGDERTKSKIGDTPFMYVWLEKGLEMPEITIAYDESFVETPLGDPQLTVEIIRGKVA